VVGVTTAKAAATRGDFIRAVIRARRQAVEFMYANPDESADIIAKAYNLSSDVSRSAVRNLLGSHDKSGVRYWSAGEINLKAMNEMMRAQKIVGASTDPIGDRFRRESCQISSGNAIGRDGLHRRSAASRMPFDRDRQPRAIDLDRWRQSSGVVGPWVRKRAAGKRVWFNPGPRVRDPEGKPIAGEVPEGRVFQERTRASPLSVPTTSRSVCQTAPARRSRPVDHAAPMGLARHRLPV
jgi:hypothetical protein